MSTLLDYSKGAALSLRALGRTSTGLAVLGDSISTRNADITIGNRAWQYPMNGFAVWANVFSGWQFWISGLGVSGNTSTQILARVGTVPNDCQIVSVLAGTNDFIGLSVGGYSAAFATARDNITAICTRLVNAGKTVIVGTIPAWASSLTSNADRIVCIANYNAYIRSLPSLFPNVAVADYWAATADPTITTALAARTGTMESDGTHPTKIGAFLMGRELWGALQRLGYQYMPLEIAHNMDSYDANASVKQIQTNPAMTGTGGTKTVGSGSISGSVPDSWRIYNNAGTTAVTASVYNYNPKVARERGTWVTTTLYMPGDGVTNGGTGYKCLQPHTSGTFATDLAAGLWEATVSTGQWQQMDVTFNAANDGTQLYSLSSMHSRVASASDYVVGAMEVEVLKAPANVNSLFLKTEATIGGQGHRAETLDDGAGSAANIPPYTWRGVLVTPYSGMWDTAGYSGMTDMKLYLMMASSAAGSLSVRARAGQVRRITTSA